MNFPPSFKNKDYLFLVLKLYLQVRFKNMILIHLKCENKCIKHFLYRVTQKKGTHLQLVQKTNILERFKNQKNLTVSALLLVYEALKNINFRPSCGTF